MAWASMFWNLHIFIGVQQNCNLVNAKKKVNITIFTIRNSHDLSDPEVILVKKSYLLQGIYIITV